MGKVNVLITGSGSIYGVAIIQSLLKTDLELKLVACDMDARTLGLHLAHRGYIVPTVQQKDMFLKRILEIINDENITAIFVASSHEIEFFSDYKAKIEEITGARIFTNPPNVLNICKDKWLTVKFLKKHGFYFPDTIRYPEDRENIGVFTKRIKFPVIIKPRYGGGSIGVYKVDDYRKLRSLLKGKKDIIIQQYLPDEHGEFTTGICTGTRGRVLSGITLKRWLLDGMTIAAELGNYNEITEYCKQVAQVLKPYGPCNFQIRLLDGKPFIFEINPRFSSSSGMRALLGVNEAEILLRAEILGEKIIPRETPKSSVIRQFTDYLIPTERILGLGKDHFCINKKD